MLTELNDTNFDEVIKQGVVVVDFWAAWCGPCRIITPTIEQLAQEHPEVTFGKLNVDEYPQLASRHGVMSIPMLLFFVDGELKDNSIGAVPKAVIEKKLELLQS
ncbi:MAG: thioredoxin [Candidatus Cloacimonetes bacterium]|nr:thioredoxin [Candidatus Cloacimonadota bacterium]